MTMWTSADAIAAEVEYRRESVRMTSRTIRRRRAARRERARRAEQVRARRAEYAAPERDDARRTEPAQRTSEPDPATRQPV